MNSEKQIARGAFILRGNHLYVANDGHGFDRNGVIALCMPNLSGKGDKIVDDHPDVSDDNWIEALNKTQLNQYINSKNRLQTDSKEEKSTIQQYSGRWILELLQNIDDALGPKEQKKYIGTKGLGFLSVMEVANNPAIFSNGFHFTFSKERNKIALLDKGLDISLAELAPSFQVPWPVKADKFEDGLLKQGFQTVIKLELRPDSIEDVKKSLQSLDHHFLLFSQNLKELQIEVDELSYWYSKYVKVLSKEESSQKCQIKLICTQGEKNRREEDWVLWRRDWDSTETNGRRSSCMFALPSKKGKCVPFKSQTKAYNFYPTEQASRLKGFLHISFDLTRDRKQFLIWGDKQDVSWNGRNCKSENKRLVEETVKLICEDVIQDKDVSAETVLKVFRPLNEFYYEIAPNGKPLKKVQIELIEQIRSCSFLPKFGGGECAPDEIKIWKHDFIDCLRENAEIGDWDLAHKDLEPLFEVLKDYDVHELSYGEVLDCLANVAIKNKSAKERTKIAEVISQYCSETAFFSPRAERDFLNIDFLSDTDSNIVSLGSDYFLKDDINPPSFLSVKCLSKRSQQDLKKYFLSLEKCALAKSINEHFISDYVSLFENQFAEFVRSKQNPDFWHDCGYEILKYAFSYFQSSEIQFKEYIANSDLTFFVPSKNGKTWKPANRSFFSASWLSTPNLGNWLKAHGAPGEGEIVGRDAFLNKLNTNSKKDLKNKSVRKDLYEFMSIIGVQDTPSLTSIKGWQGERELRKFPVYNGLLLSEGPVSLSEDFLFDGGNSFLSSFDKKDSIIFANKMIKNAEKARPSFWKKYARKSSIHPQYFNLAIFQIYDGCWLKLNESPLNPSGLFAPRECFLTEDADPVFPTLSKKYLKEHLKEDSEKFINLLKLKESFSPNKRNWKTWIEQLPSGYEELLNKNYNPAILKGQIVEFYDRFLKSDINDIDLSTSLVPAKSPVRMNKALEFKNSSSVLLNDTSLEDRELAKELANFGYSLFILDKASFSVKDLVEKLKLLTVNEKFSIKSNVERLSETDQGHYLEWLEARWVIFQALNKEFDGNKKTRLLSEVSDKLVVCESIRINIQLRDGDVETESSELAPKFFDDTLNPLTEEKLIFIKYDEGKRNLIEYLCNHFFKWSGRTELVGTLMGEPIDIDNIQNKLIENNISEDLIENFEALHKEQEEEQRKAQLVEQKKEEENLKYTNEVVERLLDEVPKKFVDTDRGLSKDNTERNVSNKNLKSGEKSISNSNAEQRASQNKEDISKKKKTYSKRQRGSFGTRISGHLRARNNNEAVGRTYFDDEDEKNTINRQVGEEAEKIVHSLIVDNFKPDDIQFYGGNNKGFDIDYKLGGETYFVEVKGLVGNWDDSDVLLSKSQFEKAQEEKDKYSIFIVENVGEAENRKIWEIRNPAELFTKMQIDHGWRNFSKSHDNLEPQKGRFLVFGGKRHKIIKVKTAGLLVTVFTENSSKPIVFKPHTMSVESESPE